MFIAVALATLVFGWGTADTGLLMFSIVASAFAGICEAVGWYQSRVAARRRRR